MFTSCSALRSRAIGGLAVVAILLINMILPAAAAAADAVKDEATKVKLKLQAGTIVDLTFDQPISAETAVVGQQVNLKLTSPILVDGKTVVDGNAMATAEVTSVTRRGMVGKAAELQVTVRQIFAVDGSIVPLTGYKTIAGDDKVTSSVIVAVLCCILGLLMKGEDAAIPAGATFRASVAAPVEITVN